MNLRINETIDSENNKKIWKVVEAIHIRMCRPSLSRQVQPAASLHAAALTKQVGHMREEEQSS